MTARVVVFGYDQLVFSTLNVVTRAGDAVAAVVFPSGRVDDRVQAVRSEVEARGFETLLQPPAAQSGPFAEQLREMALDIGMMWSYPMILPESVIDAPRLGCLNLHPALLPQYRGTNVIQRTLMNGESETGVTLHLVDPGVDTGPILAQTRSRITATDDYRTLLARSKVDGEALLSQAWPQLREGRLDAMPQDESRARYFKAVSESERRIEWSASSVAIGNLIRALTPPERGARSRVRGEEVVVWAATSDGGPPPNGDPGTVVEVTDEGIRVATGEDVLLVTGLDVLRRPETPADFGIEVGDRFDS